MAQEETGTDEPLPQRLLDNIWLLAIAAMLFWLLSYIAWGMFDIMTVPG